MSKLKIFKELDRELITSYIPLVPFFPMVEIPVEEEPGYRISTNISLIAIRYKGSIMKLVFRYEDKCYEIDARYNVINEE